MISEDRRCSSLIGHCLICQPRRIQGFVWLSMVRRDAAIGVRETADRDHLAFEGKIRAEHAEFWGIIEFTTRRLASQGCKEQPLRIYCFAPLQNAIPAIQGCKEDPGIRGARFWTLAALSLAQI